MGKCQGSLVFLMQAGFAMLCAGSIRAKNVQNILLKNLLDACGGALGFYSIGYGLAYEGGDDDSSGTTFIGTENYFFQYNLDDHIGWFFQFAFAATAATIVAGTVAERCKMEAYVCYSFFLTAFVYPVVVHSVWDGHGFLSAFNPDSLWGVGMIDFAGSGVVHMTGGCTALVAAIVLGARIGRFADEDGKPLDEPMAFKPHSVSLQMLGTFLLWFGWYGFNPGSTLAITPLGCADIAALCAVTTTLAAATGCIGSLSVDFLVSYWITGEGVLDLSMAMNGTLSGLVAITAGCSTVQPWAAVIIGLISGIVYFLASKTLIKLKVDDAVDAIPVHFANGIWGCIAVGLFADPTLVSAAYDTNEGGIFYGGGRLLACQVCGILFIIGWVITLTLPFFLLLKTFGLFRVGSLEELVGCDVSHHGGSAYDIKGPPDGAVKTFESDRKSRLDHSGRSTQSKGTIRTHTREENHSNDSGDNSACLHAEDGVA